MADELPADLFPFDPGPTDEEIDQMWAAEMERHATQQQIANLVGIRATELTPEEWLVVNQLISEGELVIDLNGDVSKPLSIPRHIVLSRAI